MRGAIGRTRISRHSFAAIAAAVLGLGLASAPPAGAIVHLGPWGGNLSHVEVHSQAGSVTDQNSQNGAGPGNWTGSPSCDAYDPDNEIDAAAVMSLHTQFDEYTFYTTSLGVSALDPGGSSSAMAVVFASAVSLDVLDVSGRRVRSLLAGEWRAGGAQAVDWDGRGDRGEVVPAGMYFVRLVAGADHRVRRVVRVNP